jgi:cyclopropane fatty-acyl-phospholipid synthase-like methyltransferase
VLPLPSILAEGNALDPRVVYHRGMAGAASDSSTYVHGYSDSEAARLGDQADALAELLHHDTHYPAGDRVLEAGCGVGAQTVHLLRGEAISS